MVKKIKFVMWPDMYRKQIKKKSLSQLPRTRQILMFTGTLIIQVTQFGISLGFVTLNKMIYKFTST